MNVIEVFADISCPFTHVGLRRFVAYRRGLGRAEPLLRVRAWPLELVNGSPLEGVTLVPKIEALRAHVAPDLFTAFDPERFPSTTLPALGAEATAYRQSVETGEQFSLAIRDALFERGLDISDSSIVHGLLTEHAVSERPDAGLTAVHADYAEGRARVVAGSPHFFTAAGDFFCPSLDIRHEGDGYQITFDQHGFEEFLAAAFR